MKLFRTVRLMLLALLVSAIPASSYAGVFISVGFAPPIMPVYDQPLCPGPGMMWTPGYWGYGPEGYYWVDGAWAPAPYIGALWTPPYWGWSSGLYIFHPGYWGAHVGYYGGVNYGFGYMGVGFVGGMWRGNVFAYNTAVMRVNTNMIHSTYVDRNIVVRNTIANSGRVAFSGGPGGINHAATPLERTAVRDQHTGASDFQQQHQQAAAKTYNASHSNTQVRSFNSSQTNRGNSPATTTQPHGTDQQHSQQHGQQHTQTQHNPAPKSNSKDDRGR